MSSRTNRTGRRERRKASLNSDPEQRRQFFRRYVLFLEGLADYSKLKHSYGDDNKDPRSLGWAIGRQISSLYLVEMLLRIDYELRGVRKGTNHHNLDKLFRGLPDDRKAATEKAYTLILNSEVEWTWDICRTVESFLDFLGTNPITSTRYPWSQQEQKGTLYSPGNLKILVDALLIGLHNYPVGEGALEKRFDTEFRSFDESRKDSPSGKGSQSRRGKRKK